MSMSLDNIERFNALMSDLAQDNAPVRVKLAGVGGMGIGLVSQLCKAPIQGVEYIAIDSDAEALSFCACPNKLRLGISEGICEKSSPGFGRLRSEESLEEIRSALGGAHIVIVIAGLGGMTATEAAPLVARVAAEAGALTICALSTPFSFEGKKREEAAAKGIDELLATADTVLVYDNNRPDFPVNKASPFAEILKQADKELMQKIEALLGFINHSGFIGIDFQDLRCVIKNGGLACLEFLTIGLNDRDKILNGFPLPACVKEAANILLSFKAPVDISSDYMEQLFVLFSREARADANLIWGAGICEDISADIELSILATGLNKYKL